MSVVYLFQFTPCVFESGYKTLSAHKTKKGAYYAMRSYIEQRFHDWMDIRERCGKDKCSEIDMKGLLDENWRIISMEVKE